MKTDASIRNISVAAVKRSIRQGLVSTSTKIYEGETIPEGIDSIFNLIAFYEGELPISHTVIDAENWTLVTSRRIISCIGGIINVAEAANVKYWDWGDFKASGKTDYTQGYVKLDDDEKVEILIETREASMIIIYSIMTLVRQLRKYDSQ